MDAFLIYTKNHANRLCIGHQWLSFQTWVQSKGLTDVINVSLLEFNTTLLVLLATSLLVLHKLEVLQLSIGFEVTSFVRSVSVDNISTVVLEISEGEEDDVADNNPNLY